MDAPFLLGRTRSRADIRRGGALAAARTIAPWLAFGAVPAVVAALVLAPAVGPSFGFDFHIFWDASRQVLHGRSPYPSPAAVAQVTDPAAGHFFVYPPLLAFALAPLAALPFGAAAAIYTVLLIGAMTLTLRLLRVTDWRCYAIAFASLPVLSSLRLGAISPLLALAAAVAWRWRDRWLVVGAAVGGAVVAKLFLWPLVVWLLVTRRFRAAAVATAGAAAATLVTWAIVGFAGLREYPDLLRTLSRVESDWGFSVAALGNRLHLPCLAIAACVVAGLLVTAYTGPADDRDARLFGAAIAVALLLTPILWLHYFTLALVPLALARPRLSAAWLLPLGFWVTPWTEPAHLPAWGITFALGLVFLATRLRRPEAARDERVESSGGTRIALRPALSRLPGGKP
jgi:hypothetical protein